MKKFYLADVNFRKSVDLTLYADNIIRAISKVKPEAEVTVTANYFSTVPELSKIESIKVSKLLRRGVLKQYTMYRPCLFNSYHH